MALQTCTACGAQATVGQRFCGDCGAPLASGCPNCGASNPPGQRFCGECGTRLDGATATAGPASTAATASSNAAGVNAAGGVGRRVVPGVVPGAGTGSGIGTHSAGNPDGSPVAERRLVSVVFADLVGFTPFSEERDPEDVRETLTRYFDLATAIITRHGGTVEKFIGDAVMAVWGTPTTREDDAERSVRAALELVGAVGELGPGIQARAGVLTGETAVTLGAQNQGMVAGDLVNTAARLQSVAAPGTVLVGEPTYRAASVAIAFEPAGEQTLKGKQAPVPAWRALRVVAERGGRGRADQLEPPFVGRDVELRLIKDLFHLTGTERRVRHVSVVGTAGIGKSRLAWEFEKYLDGIEESVRWHHGRSPAYGQGVTFWSLGEMIRSRAGLKETDDPDTGRQRIATMVESVMPNHPNRAWVEKALLQLLGLGSGVASTELFGAWRAFFEALATTGTVVLVFQDVHWADEGTLDFIDHLVEWSREHPIFIISLSRPEVLEERPGWGAARRGFATIYLEPITEAAMRELLVGLVPALPEATIRAIVRQAEGIPLFAVEIVRMLITSGELEAAEDGTYVLRGDVGEVAVPETLTALIGARLDALDAGDRALLLDAAVLGQSFTPQGLAAVSGRSVEELEPRLRALTRRELLRHVADERSPERGQYAFVQALVRETAYNTLARKDRQVRHLAAARWFETLGEPELVGALAGHFLAARELAPAGPEADALAAQARIALKAAADRAASLGSNQQALEFYVEALSVTVEPADEAEICELAGTIAQVLTAFDRAEELMRRARDIHLAAGDRSAAARLSALLGALLLNARRYEDADAVLSEAATSFADLASDPWVLRIKSQQARRLMLVGDWTPVMPITDAVLEFAEHTDDLDLLTDTLVTRGTALVNLLRWREGTAVLELALETAQANGFHSTWLRAINNILAAKNLLDPQGALDIVRSGVELAQRLGHDAWLQSLAGQLAFVAWRTGEWNARLREIEAGLEGATDARTRINAIDNLATIRAFRGEPIEDLVREMDATAALDRQDPQNQIISLDGHALTHLRAGELDEARAIWAKALEMEPTIVNSSGILLARLALWANDLPTARRLGDLHWQYVPHGGVSEADHRVIEAGIRGLEGDRAGATADYREALQRYRELRMDLDVAYTAIDLVYVLGPDDPLTVETVAAAQSILQHNSARTFQDQLDLALQRGAHAPVASAAGAARGTRVAKVPAP